MYCLEFKTVICEISLTVKQLGIYFEIKSNKMSTFRKYLVKRF